MEKSRDLSACAAISQILNGRASPHPSPGEHLSLQRRMLFPRVDTKNPVAVAALVRETFVRLFPGAATTWIERIFGDVETLFAGRHPDYAPIDLRYHDLEHTLQATVCLTLLLEGYQTSGEQSGITARQFELAVASGLLHDAGYLKLRSDTVGTGAKYTFCHVLRSCSFAASYLPSLGATESEVGGVLGAINCTGPTKEISRLHFQDPVERFVGCALATADYLGQMAAPDYPDELEILFSEFMESDDYVHLPVERRMFQSADDLIARTPDFWRKIVRPKLEKDFEGVHRYLAEPYPDGHNAYLEAVERNIAIIEARLARAAARAG